MDALGTRAEAVAPCKAMGWKLVRPWAAPVGHFRTVDIDCFHEDQSVKREAKLQGGAIVLRVDLTNDSFAGPEALH